MTQAAYAKKNMKNPLEHGQFSNKVKLTELIGQKLENNQLLSIVQHFNSDLPLFKSPFVRLESALNNFATENKQLATKLTCTVLEYVVKLIPQDHIRNFLQDKVLPTLFDSIFEDLNYDSKKSATAEDGLSYDFVDKCTVMEAREDLLLQVKTL